MVGTDYSHTITASGTPSSTYTVGSGSLPPGLTLNETTGVISGSPTTPGTSTVTIVAANGTQPDATITYELTIAPAAISEVPAVPAPESGEAGSGDQLAESGGQLGTTPLVALLAVVAGGLMIGMSRARRSWSAA
jgi:hypothetical protein